jgi:hypothetical protein
MPLLHTLRVRRRVAQELLTTCWFHLSLDNDREPEGKCGALAGLRLDPDLAAVHLNDALGDGESQPGAALLAGDSIIGVLKLLEQLRLIGSGNAWPGVTHRYIECAIVASALMALPTRLMAIGSELVALRWDDIDLATGRLHVRSPAKRCDCQSRDRHGAPLYREVFSNVRKAPAVCMA